MALTDVLKEKLKPTDALIFFTSTAGKYVEHREIVNGKMMAGKSLDIKQFSQMVRLVERYASKQKQITSINGVIPKNLLYVNPNIDSMKMVWWRGPEERKMFFTSNLDIPNGVMKVPGIVYCAQGNALSVYCFKGTKPKGILYKAPFFNVYQNGSVCLGNSKTQKPKVNTFEEWMLYWEKMFWHSEFASLISENPIEGNLATLTKRCIKEGIPFPTDVLKRATRKLEELMR